MYTIGSIHRAEILESHFPSNIDLYITHADRLSDNRSKVYWLRLADMIAPLMPLSHVLG